MGEIIAFPNPRGGCSRWQTSAAAISLAARPACAALAFALSSLPGNRRDGDGPQHPHPFLPL